MLVARYLTFYMSCLFVSWLASPAPALLLFIFSLAFLPRLILSCYRLQQLLHAPMRGIHTHIVQSIIPHKTPTASGIILIHYIISQTSPCDRITSHCLPLKNVLGLPCVMRPLDPSLH